MTERALTGCTHSRLQCSWFTGCFDSEKNQSIWVVCLISPLYVEAQGSVKFKSIYFLSEVWSCGMPCETFQGQGESWNQEIIKPVCSQQHSKMRLKQKIQQFEHRYLSRSRWESFIKFCKEVASRTLKNEKPGFKTPTSCDSTETPPRLPWLLSFCLMSGWETAPHMEDESLQSSFHSFCVWLKALG